MPDRYPTEIMPRLLYKRRMEIDKLMERHADLLAVRLAEGNVGQYTTETEGGETVLTEKVFKNSMANLSLNLAGGLFDVSPKGHLRFLPEKSVLKDWYGCWRNNNLCKEEGSYKVFEECFGLCFHVKNIHNRTFPFYKHFDTQKDRDDYLQEVAGAGINTDVFGEDAKCVGDFKSKKDNVLVHPRIRVHHAPTNANYWHVTLDTYRPNSSTYVQPEKVESSDRKMFKALKQNLLGCFEINAIPSYIIGKDEFYKRIFFHLDALLRMLKKQQ